MSLLNKCRKSPSRVHFAPVIIADDAPAAAALVRRCSHFSLSLAFYFLGRTHSILVKHNEVQIVSHRRAQSAFFVAGENSKNIGAARNGKNVI
jgi:hypothetical protein